MGADSFQNITILPQKNSYRTTIPIVPTRFDATEPK
jgi:hypothetical protein